MLVIVLVFTSIADIMSFQINTFRNHKHFEYTLKMSKSIDDWEISLKSPCKINLFLRIMGKRETGYRKKFIFYLDYFLIFSNR